MNIDRMLVWLCALTVCVSSSSCRAQVPTPKQSPESLRSDSVVSTGDRLMGLATLLVRYGREHGSLPESLDPVLSLPGVNSVAGTDAWGAEIRYRSSGPNFEVRSEGSDRVAGTTDDVVVTGRMGRSVACEYREEHRVLKFETLAPPCDSSPVVVLPLCAQPAWQYRGIQGPLANRRDSLNATGNALVRLARVVDGYGREVGGLPPTLLPLFGNTDPTDAWGHPVRYRPSSLTFELRSAGSDGAIETSDDIVISTQLGHGIPCAFQSGAEVATCDIPPPSCETTSPAHSVP
jgi:hypothetical protein